jgi:type II secretory pathway predicted ATPase ExeA
MLKHRDFLAHMLSYSDLSLVVSGVEGIGKTSFVDWLKAENSGLSWHLLEATDVSSRELLIQHLCLQLHIKPPTKLENYDQWFISILDGYHSDSPAIVVIDDAEALSLECLALVATFILLQKKTNKLTTRFVLTGKPTLEVNLRRLTDFERLSSQLHFIRLKGINKEELVNYIKYQLNHSHTGARIDANETTLSLLYANTNGAFSKLNEAIGKLVSGYELEVRQKARWLTYVYYSIGLIISISLYFLIEIPNDSMEKNIELRKRLADREPIESVATNVERSSLSPHSVADENRKASQQSPPKSTNNKIIDKQEEAVDTAKITIDKSDSEGSATGNSSVEKPKATITATAPEVIVETSSDSSTQVANSIPATATGIQAPPEQKEAAVPAAELSNRYTVDELFLLEQAKESYTNQVIAMASLSAAKKYIGKHSLTEIAYVYRRKVKDKVYFAVVVGIFSTKKEALKAAKVELRPKLGSDSLTKRLSDIHASLDGI